MMLIKFLNGTGNMDDSGRRQSFLKDFLNSGFGKSPTEDSSSSSSELK